ncbi:DNA-3-methyladenine glycosylase [Rosistilla carotiformis]|uniref:DNA-3-methyladenine glycosylase II n=1 Tax=Rosistilla carotiformis TaxID=2528017 RepID=A0A518JUJ8_9BACT|nr:DNA-3-methyladenine glycosylase [Rosistilla carotiformis]QDV69166.1 DNA-3-methyladenine glycosylase [Rosistilla carotiformis]
MSRTAKIQAAIEHLRAADPVMNGIIDDVGAFAMRLEKDRYTMLVRSIISQQISTGAARSIRMRLVELAGPDGITPTNLSRLSVDDLRTAGISMQKARYLLDLTGKVMAEELQLKSIGRYSDAEVIERLTIVKGIGKWTAQMFLIFSLGRLDVYPHDDLGVRTAIQRRYALETLPAPKTGHEIAALWRPYASVASWYCWQSLEHDKRAAANGKR